MFNLCSESRLLAVHAVFIQEESSERAAVNPSDHLRDAALHLVFIERKRLSTGSRVMQGGSKSKGEVGG